MSITKFLICALLALFFLNCKHQQAASGAPVGSKTEKSAAIEKAARFNCHGNEPFWYVKIEPDSGIVYNQMDEGMTRFPYKAPRLEGTRMIFESNVDGSKIKITIDPGQCSDGMSDELYPYACMVEKDKTTLSGCAK